MSEPLIAADRLNVRAGGVHIIDDVSLAIYPREIVVLIGPNGSGKTTLLKALLGLVRAEGKVVRRSGLKIGYVPQQFARDPSLPITVDGFLGLFAKSEARAAALERVDIAHTKNRQLVSLSGGELARVLLARALAGAPQLLVLDEPLAGVDVAGEAALYHLIAEIRDELGCGVLLVSHDLHVVMAQASRVICLNCHICCEGHPEAVMRDPAFRELFGARAASELALYAHHHDHAHGPSGEPVQTHG
ncbi:MAG: metal ABC transporter ATP-binding protein [Rhizomicrobium sp.]|jgi:zinc transport system ATP-binding protein